MKQPTGKDLLKTLIDLYTKQEGVKIKYELTERQNQEKVFRSREKCGYKVVGNVFM